MKIFNIFRIFETYRNWKSRKMEFKNDKAVIIMENLQIQLITSPNGQTPNMEDVRLLLNEAIEQCTKEVRAEYGF